MPLVPSSPLAPIDPPEASEADACCSGVAVVGQSQAAGMLTDPIRRRILSAVQAPGSATTVAGALGMSRQLVNYHLRALERAGLVEEVERRRRRGLEERVVRATAAYYLISPSALGSLGESPTDVADAFSATYQVAVAARTIREVAALAALARQAGKRLTTLTVDTVVRFASPSARQAFTQELVATVNRIVARYHAADAPDGREYRVFFGAHPVFAGPPPSEDPPARLRARAGRKRRTRARRPRRISEGNRS